MGYIYNFLATHNSIILPLSDIFRIPFIQLPFKVPSPILASIEVWALEALPRGGRWFGQTTGYTQATGMSTYRAKLGAGAADPARPGPARCLFEHAPGPDNRVLWSKSAATGPALP